MANWVETEAKRLAQQVQNKNEAVLETGFGASGLPHIGTFAEVARTTMVRRAFEQQSGKATKLLCFSDDMDGLRKVPENLPNQEMLADHLGKPLTQIPDPFEQEPSFAHYNNKKLRGFLDAFEFEYTFCSATEFYQSGQFDETLKKILTTYEPIKNIVKKTLGEERQKTYSPFLPLCPRTGKVLMVEVIATDEAKSTITYLDPETTERTEVSILGGACKLQWKVDWAMRWAALGVDYEMAGKDLADSVKLSSAICRVMRTTPPTTFIYELFLDEAGEKISKSRGNGLTMEQWLRYGPVESLSRFLLRPPKSARKLHFDIIPNATDEYIKDSAAAADTLRANTLRANTQAATEVVPNGITFTLLLNLVSASQAETPQMLWQFVRHLAPNASPEANPFLDRLISCAINYFQDFIQPHKAYRAPTDDERKALLELQTALENLEDTAAAADIQQLAYDIGTANHFELAHWFRALYEVLLGQSQGARFGSFVALYGIKPTIQLIKSKLASSS